MNATFVQPIAYYPGHFTKKPFFKASRAAATRMNHLSTNRARTVVRSSAGIKVNHVSTSHIEGQKTGTSGLRKKAAIFASENYLANWVQSLFLALPSEEVVGSAMVLGGDGRWFNKEAAKIIIKLAAGNGVGKVFVGQHCIRIIILNDH